MPDINFDTTTQAVRDLFSLAVKEAQRCRHECIGTEHLLLAMTADKSEDTSRVFRALGLSAETLRARIESGIHPGPSKLETSPQQFPFGVHSKRAIELALVASKRFGYLAPEHLMYGLVSCTEGFASEVICSFNITSLDVENIFRGGSKDCYNK